MEIEVVKFFQRLVTPVLNSFYYLFTLMGEEIFFFAVFLAFYWCVKKETAIRFGSFYLISVGLNKLVKGVFKRSRPYMASEEVKNLRQTSGYSFPSGHSQSYGFIAAFLGFNTLINIKIKKWQKIMVCVILGLLGLMVGFSRLYFGQHYLSDVLCGLTFGLIIFLTCELIWIMLKDKAKIFNTKFLLLFLSLFGVLLIIVISINNFLEHNSAKHVFTFAGAIVALTAGYFIDERFINFNPINKLWYIQLSKLIVGYLAVGGSVKISLTIFKQTYWGLFAVGFVAGLISFLVLPYVYAILDKYIEKHKNNNKTKQRK